MKRVVIISDVGGHLDYLEKILEKDVRVNDKGIIPKNTHFILNGDIVHKGPDSEACLALTADLLDKNENNMTVTVGNHEEHYLGDIPFWRDEIAQESQDLLKDLWENNRLTAGVAVQSSNRAQYLVTHAGITPGYWDQVLAHPLTPSEAADRLAGIRKVAEPYLWYPGCMITGERDAAAGPVWASSSDELYPAWAHVQLKGKRAPRNFHQIHGHSTPYFWQARKWYLHPDLRPLVDLNYPRHRSVTTISGNRFIGIDPGHSTRATDPETWSPYIVNGEVIPTVPKLVSGMNKILGIK